MKRRSSNTSKKMLAVVALCLVLMPVQALAQDTPSTEAGALEVSTLEIALWPEFDRPDVLVIYRGLLAEDSELPAPVELRIPARVGQPTAVAYVDDVGQRLNQEYTTYEDGDWLVVSFALPMRGFQLEYYDALATDSAAQREHTYTYVADYDTGSLSVEFQVPPTAEGFTLDPPADSSSQASDGLVYHSIDAGSLAQGEERQWTFTYGKADSDLTVEGFADPEAAEPPPAASTAAGGEDISTFVIFLIAFVALVAVGGAAYWLGRRTQPPSPPPPSSRTKRRGSGRGPAQASPGARPGTRENGAVFCYQCGTDLRPDSEFCHRCGAAVRDE